MNPNFAWADEWRKLGYPKDARVGEDGHLESGTLGVVPDYPAEALPRQAKDLVDRAVTDGLPAALLGGACLAALAGAVGAQATLQVVPSWHERAILWLALLAPRGAGKSPSQDLAFGPLRDHDALLEDDDDVSPVRFGDQTLEALARNLHVAKGAGVVDVDELATLLRGLGEYKRGGGGDRGRFLSLWSGAPWTFDRVGGGAKRNKVRLRIPRPTLVICGGLQSVMHELLGGEDDGLRPRWLPHLAALPDTGSLSNGSRPVGWQALLGGELLPARRTERTWKLSKSGLRAFEHYRGQWKQQARQAEAASVAAALVKADVHLARVALVLAEADNPAAGGQVGAEVVQRAAAIVDFTLNCWRALPEQGTLSLTRRDWLLDRSVIRLLTWLEDHGGEASRRDLQRACVAGCRTADDLNALLARYEATFPGCVLEAAQAGGHGLPTMVVKAPSRRPVIQVSAYADTSIDTDPNPHGSAENDTVGSADTSGADTSGADTSDVVHLGDDAYPLLLADAVRDGHLTRREAEQQYALHELARAAEEDRL